MNIKDVLDQVKTYLPPDKVATVAEAYRFADKAHQGQMRLSGTAYIDHPLHTARFLADLRMDVSSIAAALLHDVMEDCGISPKTLEESFGPEVVKLVDGVTKLNRLDLLHGTENERSHQSSEDKRLQAESLRKMLLAMATDVRVVLIKLADRLHNMRTLGALPPHRRAIISQETLDIYTPLAHRLGIWEIKWQLEDLSFRHLKPVKYRKVSRLLAVKREEREIYISRIVNILRETLVTAGVDGWVTGRPKHLYSIYKKMEKYASIGREFNQIYDLYALRVLVSNATDCYNVLGLVHRLWHPIPGEFDDYIASPKENMYQALQTTVMCEGAKPLEVQIRTHEMHELAEYGVAAHWRYKEGADGDTSFEERMTWLRQLLEWQREVVGAEEFLESVRTDIFNDQVFVRTPKGDIRELPNNSTPLDFAFRIHTELGYHCIGAKVNGQLVGLDYQLKNGDTIEILTSKVARGPSLDWLNPDLGYVRTAHAREKIRQWLRKQQRGANIRQGQELIARGLKRFNIATSELEIAQLFKFESVKELLASVGSGNITMNQIVSRLTTNQPRMSDSQTNVLNSMGPPMPGIQVLGTGNLLTRIAQCCSPVPGDEIKGFINRRRGGVTVHRTDCPSPVPEDKPGRLVKVKWGEAREFYPIRLDIEAWDRVGLLSDLTSQVSNEGINISGLITKQNPDSTILASFTIYTSDMAQLSRLFSRLEGVRGVVNVARSLPPGSNT